jgi:hypothetical protein
VDAEPGSEPGTTQDPEQTPREAIENAYDAIEAARASLSLAGASGYDLVHAEWYEDPDAVHPDEVLTFATSPEGIRRAYRRYGARFEVDGVGELTLKLDFALDGGVLSLTSSRT